MAARESTVELNVPEVVHSLDALKSKQLPYATAVAINSVLRLGQADVRASLPQRFTIRNRWTASGVRVEFADKRRPWGVIKHIDARMTLHETGGEKRPEGRFLAVPSRALLRKGSKGIVARSWRPRRALERKGVFVAKGLILRARRGGREPPERLYTFIDRARIRPQFGFEDTVEKTVRRAWAREFGKALARAIKTAR